MQIDILQLTEGAKRAKGTTVVIDVFRAFSTACYLVAAGAARIIPVEHIEEALALKEQIPDAILLGERSEKKVEGFDFGNSPTHIEALDFRDKTIVMTTSSGTRGLMNATGADEILSGSFVNAGAIVRYLKSKNPSTVSLVCMGYEGKRPTQEDTFLAEYIRAKLLDQVTDFEQMKEILRKGDGARLLDPNNHTWSPASDFDLCLDLDRFDFVLKLTEELGRKVLKVTKMKKYDFDEIIPRKGTDCEKYDHLQSHFGNGNAIPLWVADGDFRVPDFITAAIRYRADHEIYAYSFRPEGYYNSIIKWQQNRHDWHIERDMILPTQGVVSTLASIIMAFTEVGDKVIIQPPVYTPFFTCVKDCGRTVVENPLKAENGSYTFDFEDLIAKMDMQTRLLILCNPHNPVGRVWTKEELSRLGDICLENNVLIISDEIHSDLVFSGYKHLPLPKISDQLAANCIVCMAPSKTFNIAGLSTSFVIIPDKKIRQKFDHFLHTLHLSNGNLFGNVALQAAYQFGLDWVNQQNEYLEANRDFMLAFFKNKMPKIRMTFTEATYLAWIDVREYGLGESEMNRILIDRAEIVLNKGSIYGKVGDGFFRVNFACPRQVLEEALTRMEKVLGG